MVTVSVSLCDVVSYTDPYCSYNCCHRQIGQRTLGKKAGKWGRGKERRRRKERRRERNEGEKEEERVGKR